MAKSKYLKKELLVRKHLYTNPEGGKGKRKVCFCPKLNRTINWKDSRLKPLMRSLKGGWTKDHPAIVFPAEDVETNLGTTGSYTFYDINGKEIPESELHLYYLVLDAQHRIASLSELLEAGEAPEGNSNVFPSKFPEFQAGENIAKYLERINGTVEAWKSGQYVSTLYNLNPGNELLERYSKWIRVEDGSPEDKKKFPLATLNLIYYANKGIINDTTLKKIVRGEAAVPLGYNIKDGDRFINLLLSKFTAPKVYSSRYLSEYFIGLKNTLGSAEAAFKVFEKLTVSHIADMQKPCGKSFSLIPEKAEEILQNLSKKV